MNKLISFCFLFLSFHCAFSQTGRHHYREGEALPSLQFITVSGDTVNTDALRGKKILITFNRYVSCPLCNFRTHELLSFYDTLEAGELEIISIYESSKQQLLQYAGEEVLPFAVVADPEEIFYKHFRVQKSWWKSFLGLFNHYHQKHSTGKRLFKSEYERDGHLNRIGADFLIDQNGIVSVAYYGRYVGDHLPVVEIKRWLMKQ